VIPHVLAHAWRIPNGVVPNPFATSYALRIVAPLCEPPAKSRNERFLRRMGLYGMEVAHEAFRAAGVPAGPRYGFFTGVGGLRAHWDDMLAALADQDDSGSDAWQRGLVNVHPYWMLRHLSNNVHALASAELGLRGEGATFGGAEAGLHALRAARRALADGAIDHALVVAYDSLLEPETLVELGERAPSDFVPGEAAAAVVLARDGGACLPVPAVLPDGVGSIGAATAVVALVAALRGAA
jgi:3-oxoacyl-(acyl-carrier-protein) synthase